MEMMKGFKNTEGVVTPEDWEVKKVGDIFHFYSTANYSKAQMSLVGEIGCMHYGLIHAIPNTNYSLEKGVKYYIETDKTKYELIKDGDVVMVDASEDLAGINKSVEVFGVGDRQFISGLHTYLMRDLNSILVNNFRGQILNSSIAKNQMLRLAVGMKVFGVSKTQLKEILLPLPPTAEQTAIATALTDMDALITQTERLIQKKKAIKQGLMQDLLLPKVGWEVKTLGDIGECIIGLTYKPSNVKKDGILVLRSSNIQGNSLAYDNNVFVDVEVSEKLILKKGDILICVRNGSRNLIGKCAYIDGRAIGETFGAFMSIFRSPFNDYIFHVFQSNLIQKQIEESLGATINQITNKSLNSFEIPYPSIEEQTRIAQILSDADNEIQGLEQKLEKLQQQKQGMMQALLTGKIRLTT